MQKFPVTILFHSNWQYIQDLNLLTYIPSFRITLRFRIILHYTKWHLKIPCIIAKFWFFGKTMDTFWDPRVLTLEESDWFSFPFVQVDVHFWNSIQRLFNKCIMKQISQFGNITIPEKGLHDGTSSSAMHFLCPFLTWAANFPPVPEISDSRHSTNHFFWETTSLLPPSNCSV